MISFNGRNIPVYPSIDQFVNSDKQTGQLVTLNGKSYLVFSEIAPQTSKIKQIFLRQVQVKQGAVELNPLEVSLMQGGQPGFTDPKQKNYLWFKGTAGLEHLPELAKQGFLFNLMIHTIKTDANQKTEARSRLLSFEFQPELVALTQTVKKMATKLTRHEGGAGGAYFLKSPETGKLLAVVKPANEGPFQLHNAKGLAIPIDSPELVVREGISRFAEPYNEAMAYQIATLIGCDEIAPPTTLGIIEHEGFFLFQEKLDDPNIAKLFNVSGDKEKLCSIQAAVTNYTDLGEAMTVAGQEGKTVKLHQQDFEDCNLLIWVTGDQDAHTGNFMISNQPDASGAYRMKKIDNGLILGRAGMRNYLDNQLVTKVFDQNNSKPLSELSKQKIAAIRTDLIEMKMLDLGYESSSIDAMKARVKSLQSFVDDNPEASIKEINQYVAAHYAS
jgi:hypothetical protein